MQLFGNILHLSSLDVQLILKDMRSAEGTYTRLVTFCGRQIIGACVL